MNQSTNPIINKNIRNLMLCAEKISRTVRMYHQPAEKWQFFGQPPVTYLTINFINTATIAYITQSPFFSVASQRTQTELNTVQCYSCLNSGKAFTCRIQIDSSFFQLHTNTQADSHCATSHSRIIAITVQADTISQLRHL